MYGKRNSITYASYEINMLYLLSYYLANKRSLHVRSQGLEIPTLIGEKRKIKITHHCHYEKISLKYPCA